MSIHPVAYNPNTQIYTMLHDEGNHQFDIVLSEINFIQKLDGLDHLIMHVKCLICNGGSSHPASGGADALNIQQLFVNKTQSAGCVCGSVTVDDTNAVAESHVRLNCNKLDGPGRWQIDDATLVRGDLYANSKAEQINFQTVYRQSDRLIIGLNAVGGVGPDNAIKVWHTQEDYDNLMRFDPAYVSSDGNSIVDNPTT